MSYSNGPKFITNGLVLYLDAANPKSYISGSGTWYDLSPSKNDSVLTNGPTFNNSLAKGCIEVDGSNDYIQTSNTLNITGNAARTFMISFYYISNQGWGNIYTYGSGDCNALMFGLGYFPNGNGIVIWGGCYDIATNLIPQSNAWHLICIRYDGNGNVYARMNASTYTATGRTYNTVNSHLFLGAETTTDGASFRTFVRGKYGICSVYNRCLTDAEVSQNFNSLKGRYNL